MRRKRGEIAYVGRFADGSTKEIITDVDRPVTVLTREDIIARIMMARRGFELYGAAEYMNMIRDMESEDLSTKNVTLGKLFTSAKRWMNSARTTTGNIHDYEASITAYLEAAQIAHELGHPDRKENALIGACEAIVDYIGDSKIYTKATAGMIRRTAIKTVELNLQDAFFQTATNYLDSQSSLNREIADAILSDIGKIRQSSGIVKVELAKREE